jgi:signal transduction histidine kinase
MEAVSRGESTWITDLASDPRVATWSDIVAQHHVRAAATVPLLRDGRPVAVLALFSDRAGDLDLEMRGLIEHVAANVSFALDALAATAGLRTVAAHRRELLERLATAQESERQRIAGDIHDDSVQTLAAVELRLSLLGRQVPDVDSERLVWSLREQVSHVISGLRDLLFELEPAHLDRGLPDLADEACHYLLGPHGIQWDVEMDRVPRLGDTQHLQLVRILKEALTNVVKHARATRVKVAFTSDEHELTMLVEDDGTGLSSGGILGGAGHRGVQTMHDRAEAAGGRCRIEGSPSGTTVTVWLPIEPDAL